MAKSYKIAESDLPRGWKVGWILFCPLRRKQYEIIDMGCDEGTGPITLRKLPLSERLTNTLVMGQLMVDPIPDPD
jgi:hypothetical protein